MGLACKRKSANSVKKTSKTTQPVAALATSPSRAGSNSPAEPMLHPANKMYVINPIVGMYMSCAFISSLNTDSRLSIACHIFDSKYFIRLEIFLTRNTFGSKYYIRLEKGFGTLYLGCCKLENEILKEAKNAQKWHFWVSKWSFLVIFQGF